MGDSAPDPRCGEKTRSFIYGKDPWWEIFDNDIDTHQHYKSRKCTYKMPAGGNKPKITFKGQSDGLGGTIPKGYTALPSPEELVNTCTNVKYENIYIDILEMRLLEIVLEIKSKIIYEAIMQATKGSNAVALQQTKSGRQLLKNLKLHEASYKKYYKNKRAENQLQGMLEDISKKKSSANISYYIWFILAISGMLLVIKKIRS